MTYKMVLGVLLLACCQLEHKTVIKDCTQKIQNTTNVILQS